ncbi:MAG: hypothetical protein LBT43_02590 [Prevotella sp.]|jgi:hypothetical protein|nr:hypothetical protein [Prevotella sp.]
MKKLLTILLSLLVLVGCSDEDYPLLEPYIYFADNVDYYVVDPDVEVAYTITGSFSAEGMIQSVSIDGVQYTEEEIGAELTSTSISHTVDLTGFTESRTIRFTLTDKRGKTTTQDFHFIKAQPVETFVVELGAQNNSVQGFFLSLTDYKTYSVTDFLNTQKDVEGICFGYNKDKKEPLLLSPTGLQIANVLQDKGNKMVSIGSVPKVDGAAFTKMENDAIMKNLVGASFRTFEYTTARNETSYLFKTESGRWGMLYVQEMLSGLAGNMKVIVKIEKVGN